MNKAFNMCSKLGPVPMLNNLEEVFHYVSSEFFEPPLGHLEAYEYPGKHGHGPLVPLANETTLTMVKRRQKDRHVPSHRLSIMGKSDLSEYA